MQQDREGGEKGAGGVVQKLGWGETGRMEDVRLFEKTMVCLPGEVAGRARGSLSVRTTYKLARRHTEMARKVNSSRTAQSAQSVRGTITGQPT